MTYASREASAQSGNPLYLFEFTQGSTFYRYTTRTVEHSWDSRTWTPEAVGIGPLNSSADMTKDTLSVKLPLGNPLARTFLGGAPDVITSVTVYRGHLDDPDAEFQTYWKGRVASHKGSGPALSLECEPIFTSLRSPGLRARFQKTCRHALYHRGCGLDMEDFGSDGTCTAASGSMITVAEAASLPAGHLVGGILRVTADGIMRYIVSHSGDQIGLMRSVGSIGDLLLSGPVAVRMYPGCDRSRATCIAKFNNLDNFGGFPWIPSKNPLGGSSIM